MKKEWVIFATGGVGYCALETLWRGRTHPSMALCGGTALVLLKKLFERGGGTLFRCLGGGAVITGCELVCGLVFNQDRQVWDYSRLPGNFRGQICLPFSLLWVPLGLAAAELYPRLSHMLKR